MNGLFVSGTLCSNGRSVLKTDRSRREVTSCNNASDVVHVSV